MRVFKFLHAADASVLSLPAPLPGPQTDWSALYFQLSVPHALSYSNNGEFVLGAETKLVTCVLPSTLGQARALHHLASCELVSSLL